MKNFWIVMGVIAGGVIAVVAYMTATNRTWIPMNPDGSETIPAEE